jgi:hypothetical protein
MEGSHIGISATASAQVATALHDHVLLVLRHHLMLVLMLLVLHDHLLLLRRVHHGLLMEVLLLLL